MGDIKIPPPRQLQERETLETLDQFQNQFRLFYKRAESLKEFFKPNFTWNPKRDFFGLRGEDSEERSENLELILAQLGSHLPFPYLTQRFVKEAKSWEEVWKIVYTHYGVQPSQVSFIHYSILKKTALK